MEKVGKHYYKLSGHSKWWETVDDVDKTHVCEKIQSREKHLVI